MLLRLLRLILWRLRLLCSLLLLLLLLGLRELCFHLRVIFTPRPTRALQERQIFRGLYHLLQVVPAGHFRRLLPRFPLPPPSRSSPSSGRLLLL